MLVDYIRQRVEILDFHTNITEFESVVVEFWYGYKHFILMGWDKKICV